MNVCRGGGNGHLKNCMVESRRGDNYAIISLLQVELYSFVCIRSQTTRRQIKHFFNNLKILNCDFNIDPETRGAWSVRDHRITPCN